MTEAEQLAFLLGLGRRLDNWTSPGDAEDHLAGHCLWDRKTKEHLPAPARVVDVLLARWIRIKDFRTQRPVNFVLNAAQRSFSKQRTSKNVILKAGRAGFTAYLAGRALIRTMTRQGHTAILVAHRKDSAQDYFLQVHFALEHLEPPLGTELRKGALRTGGPGGKQNVRELYFPALNSRFFVATAGEFAPAEGESIQDLLADEIARWVKGDPAQVLATLLSHVNGDDTEINLFSRPFGDTGEFYDRYQLARSGASDFRAHFFQWWWNPGQAVKADDFALDPEERQVAKRYCTWRASAALKDCGLPSKLSLQKLAWRRSQKKELRDLFAQEFAEDDIECFLGSDNCSFDAVAMDKVLKDLTPIIERTSGAGEPENGLWTWRHPEPGHRYLLFGDLASTLHLSRDAFFVLDLDTLEQCAEFVGRMTPLDYAGLVNSVGLRYNRAKVAIENNLGKISATVLTALANYPNLYVHVAAGEQSELGWHTDGQSRPSMFETFSEIFTKHPEKFHSRRLVGEMKNHVRNGDRIEPKKGTTGDLVIAAAGAHEIRRLGNWAREPEVFVITTAKPGLDQDLMNPFNDSGFGRSRGVSFRPR